MLTSLFNSCRLVNGGAERTGHCAPLRLYVSIYATPLLQIKPQLL